MLVGGAITFVWDRPLAAVGNAVERVVNATLRRGRPLTGRSASSPSETLRTAFGRRWQAAVLAAAGKSIFDYGARRVPPSRRRGAEPSLILLAYVASAILAMIPFTPGGLGFVEASSACRPRGRREHRRRRGDARLPARLLLAADPGRGGVRALPLPVSVDA